jgi:hypothetical protein
MFPFLWVPELSPTSATTLSHIGTVIYETPFLYYIAIVAVSA